MNGCQKLEYTEPLTKLLRTSVSKRSVKKPMLCNRLSLEREEIHNWSDEQDIHTEGTMPLPVRTRAIRLLPLITIGLDLRSCMMVGVRSLVDCYQCDRKGCGFEGKKKKNKVAR
jgi:hypothetical protein